MTYSELICKYNFEFPSYGADYFDDFIKNYDRSVPVLSASDAEMVADTASLPGDGKEALVKCAEIINNNDEAHLLASFLACVTVYKRVPWVNYIGSNDLFTVEGLHMEQVGWVLVATQLCNTLKNKKPPMDLNEENLRSFRDYSSDCKKHRGYWGILEWHWNMLGSGGCMFMFGILKFVPGQFTGDFPVITDGKSYVSLVGGSYFYDKNGALVRNEESAAGKTEFYEDAEKYVGHVVSANGVVSAEKTEFSKRVWKDYLREGTSTIDIHIPSRVEYTPEKIREAYKLAVEFYKDFYPDHNPKAIAGYSWIFAPQLEKVLPEGSNILAVNRSMHILPTTGTFDYNCRFIREGSSLQARMKEENEKGTEFHYAVMYTAIDEIETFGKEIV